MKIAADGYRFLIPLLALTLLCAALRWRVAAAVTALLFLFVLYFFRDPERQIPSDPEAIVSPADGRVVHVGSVGGELPLQVSIFLSVFDVHVNRAPFEGEIRRLEHRTGKFKAAFDASASVENEQTIVEMQTRQGPLRLALIAGLIARRIVTWIQPNQTVRRGARIGIIRFGSRVDLFLPRSVQIQTKKGDRVRAGESIIGRFQQISGTSHGSKTA